MQKTAYLPILWDFFAVCLKTPYILRLLYTGCQWKELPIEKDEKGRPEIHYTRIYRMFRFWHVRGCLDAIFSGSVSTLDRKGFLMSVSFTAMARLPQQKKAATTSGSADTRE